MAEIIQFVPRPNPNRELNALEIAAVCVVGQITEPGGEYWHEPGTADLNEVPRAEE